MKTAALKKKQTILKRLFFQFSPNGFTLIELLVVFSVAATLSIVGFAAFSTYSRLQTLQSGVNEFATYLQTAKSRAQSQVIDSNGTNMCGVNPFSGYEVDIYQASGLNRSLSTCEYEMDITCNNSNVNPLGYNPIVSKNLPPKLCVSSSIQTSFVQFIPLKGGVANPQVFTINGDGYKQTVTVTSEGNIVVGTVSSSTFTCPAKPGCP